MEMFKDNKPEKAKDKPSESFKLVKAAKMDPFKIEIFSEEFLDIMADIISNPGTKYNSMKEMVEGIKKPITMKIETEVYDGLKTFGDTNDIEMVCKYIAVQRIVGAVDDEKFTNMISKAKESTREVTVSTRHVLTTAPAYKMIFALIPAAYLSSVCNLSSVGADVAKMDKDNAKYMTKIMENLKEMTAVEGKIVSEAHGVVLDLVQRILFAYRDSNLIDLANVRKDLNEMFEGDLKEYFSKLMNQIDKDLGDSFASFNKLVKEMSDEDSTKFSSDNPEPYEYDEVEEPTEEIPEGPDLENDSVLGPNDVPPDQAAPAASTGGVVTGLESVNYMEEKISDKAKSTIKKVGIGLGIAAGALGGMALAGKISQQTKMEKLGSIGDSTVKSIEKWNKYFVKQLKVNDEIQKDLPKDRSIKEVKIVYSSRDSKVEVRIFIGFFDIEEKNMIYTTLPKKAFRPDDIAKLDKGVVSSDIIQFSQKNESLKPTFEGLPGFRKKLRRISKSVIGYIKVKGSNARDADELTMYVSYGYSVAERCEWYMDIIERQDDRYIVPQTFQELSTIKDGLYKVLDEVTKQPFFRSKGSIFRNGVDPYNVDPY